MREDRLLEGKLITFILFIFLPIGVIGFLLIRSFKLWGFIITLIVGIIGVWFVYLYWRRLFEYS